MNMHLPFLFILSLAFMNCNNSSSNSDIREVTFLNSTIEFATLEQSKTLLSTSDEFTQALSPFDYVAKTQDLTKDSEEGYLQYAADQAQEWTSKDINKCIKMIGEAEVKIKELGLQLGLPSKVVLVNSNCKEEGGAQGYTRGDFIVVNGQPDEHLFLHELWHIISRENPSLRDAAYEVIGFKKMPRAVFPNELNKLRITNPDAPFMEHYLPVMIDGEEKNVIITTMASAPYTEGSFFKYLMIVLYEVTIENSESKVISSPPYAMEKPSNLRDKIGRNTDYIIHPEEITAEHFTMLVTCKKVKSQDLIDNLKLALSK